ncbi:hypothetical protein FQA39_LY06588 [Lamprigera yunnana]|nr:hypothetical protein FQA39_LY06588 [Lamprigera yunnana]
MVNLWENNKRDITSENCNKNGNIKKHKSEVLKLQIRRMKNIVQSLENSVEQSNLGDKQLLKQIQVDNIRNLSIIAQLNESRKENKQLLSNEPCQVSDEHCCFLDILQQKYQEKPMSRFHRGFDSFCSTMSMVNLQYKYEELLRNHEDLLKLLATKERDVERMCKENDNIYDKTVELSNKLILFESLLKKICIKYTSLKEKKETKMLTLRAENETLCLVHNQLVLLLNNQYMENENILRRYLQNEETPLRALLLQEVQRANKLHHENMLLKRELACLKSSKFSITDKNQVNVNFY